MNFNKMNVIYINEKINEERLSLNKIWPWLVIISLVVGIFNGKVEEITTSLFESAKSSIETCINIFGIISLWSGLMNIAEKSKLIEKAQKVVYPAIKFLFPDVPKDSNAIGNIAMNMTANIIGLGNVATPVGLKAMEELQKINPKKDCLSKSMLMFLVLNMSSIQLIPTTVIALRTSYGSQNPAEVVIPVIISSFTAVIVGVIIVKAMYFKRK